jgi:hypothetical protein
LHCAFHSAQELPLISISNLCVAGSEDLVMSQIHITKLEFGLITGTVALFSGGIALRSSHRQLGRLLLLAGIVSAIPLAISCLGHTERSLAWWTGMDMSSPNAPTTKS